VREHWVVFADKFRVFNREGVGEGGGYDVEVLRKARVWPRLRGTDIRYTELSGVYKMLKSYASLNNEIRRITNFVAISKGD
jgi:hypothetical protein